MVFYGLSDVGKIRKNNEDSFYVKSYDDTHMLAIVADGMGGHNGGKQASTIAVESISAAIESLIPEIYSYTERKLKQTLTSAVKNANSAIYESAKNSPELKGMGTTIVICLIFDNKLYAVNAGDSRLYLLNNSIIQITKDHSFVNELVELGVISEQQAMQHPQKNVITRALGTEETIEVDIYIKKISKDDTVLMCTDGLTNMIGDETILDVVHTEPDLNKATSALIDEAKKSGGNDNITVVMIGLQNGGEA